MQSQQSKPLVRTIPETFCRVRLVIHPRFLCTLAIVSLRMVATTRDWKQSFAEFHADHVGLVNLPPGRAYNCLFFMNFVRNKQNREFMKLPHWGLVNPFGCPPQHSPLGRKKQKKNFRFCKALSLSHVLPHKFVAIWIQPLVQITAESAWPWTCLHLSAWFWTWMCARFS